MLILALGIDNRWDSYYYGLADVIRVVRVDFLTGGVSVLTLPRDLWVEIPGLGERNITHGKLNQAYLYGSELLGYYDGPDLGPGLMLETLDLNYDLEINKYITLNMITVEKVIDAAGGIDIYLPYDVNGVSEDPPVNLGYFEAGPQHFTGEKAVRFARVRMIDNDIQRSIRQSWVLEALWKKLISPAILPRIPDLVHALYGSVQTNLKASDVRQLTCLAPLIADQKIRFVSLPAEMLVGDRIFVERYMKTLFYWNIDPDELTALLADFQNGTWPPPQP
jgi:LCP family protein required for cell wall assembly